jgi:hypothetical protein
MIRAFCSAATAALAFAVTASGCSLSGHGGGGMTEAQCKAVFQRGYELQGTTEAEYGPVIDPQAKACAEHDALSKKDYDCALAATTLDQYQACKVVLDFS